MLVVLVLMLGLLLHLGLITLSIKAGGGRGAEPPAARVKRAT